MRIFAKIVGFVGLVVVLCSWGSVGHSIINYNAPKYFPASMVGFSIWADSLSNHASDADNRKSSDNTESPKHYIDIDNYSEFVLTGKIASTYDSIIKIHTTSFVTNNGTLPWATKNTYDSLKNAFQKRNWHKAVLFASDLGHYVADGNMPLHLTENYDGKTSAQSGIHSRYESTMVGSYRTSLKDYTGFAPIPVSKVTNVNLYVLKYIYSNNRYTDSIFNADTYAQTQDASFTTAYYTALWNKTQFTKTLFRNASYALAELIYSAWIDAGSPPYGTTPVEEITADSKLTVYPNPTAGEITIKSDDVVKAEVYSLQGKVVAVFNENHFNVESLENGIYILSVYGKQGWLIREKITVKK